MSFFPGLQGKGIGYLQAVASSNGFSMDRVEFINKRKTKLTMHDTHQKKVLSSQWVCILVWQGTVMICWSNEKQTIIIILFHPHPSRGTMTFVFFFSVDNLETELAVWGFCPICRLIYWLENLSTMERMACFHGKTYGFGILLFSVPAVIQIMCFMRFLCFLRKYYM